VGGHVPQKPVFIKLSNRQEITMTQKQQHKNASPPTTGSKRKSRIGHWLRVVVMFLSGAFIFPHALTEDEDIAKYDADKDAKVKKQ
jgi:hypothetical protein